jgi:hypothetical protein
LRFAAIEGKGKETGKIFAVSSWVSWACFGTWVITINRQLLIVKGEKNFPACLFF